NELVTLGYLIKVNNGVYLIRHWLLNNNKIPNDRYKESIYKEFLDNNIIYDEESENKIYELREPEEQEQDKHLFIWKHLVYGMFTGCKNNVYGMFTKSCSIELLIVFWEHLVNMLYTSCKPYGNILYTQNKID